MDGRRLFGSAKGLWVFRADVSVSLLAVALRHLRFFTEPLFLLCTGGLSAAGRLFWKSAFPRLYISDMTLLAGLAFLILRRAVLPQVRYISLFADYFALILIAAVRQPQAF